MDEEACRETRRFVEEVCRDLEAEPLHPAVEAAQKAYLSNFATGTLADTIAFCKLIAFSSRAEEQGMSPERQAECILAGKLEE